MEKFKVHPVKDRLDKFKVEHPLFNLPMRGIICAKSGQGKSLLVVNMILQWYRKYFKPQNIYLILGTKLDDKIQFLIKKKNISPDNIMYEYDEVKLHSLYGKLSKEYEYNVENNINEQFLILIDDFGYSNDLNGRKHNAIINLLYCNGRHFGISTVSIYQKYTSQISTTIRSNLTFGIFFKTTNTELDQLSSDSNYIPNDNNNKIFKKIFQDATKEKHSTFCVNYSKGFNDIDKLYMRNFEYIDVNKYIEEAKK